MDAEPPWEYGFTCEISPAGELTFTGSDLSLAARLGFEARELSGPRGWMRVVPPEDIGRCVDAMGRLVQGHTFEDRVRFRSADGETLILHVRVTPTPLGNGGVSLVVEGRDVTQIAQIETALENSQALFRLLDSNLSLLFWTTDSTLRLTSSAGSILGDSSLVGTSLLDFFEASDPDPPPVAAHRQALRGETVAYNVEWEDRALRCFVGPLWDELGRVSGVTGVAIDRYVLTQVVRATEPSAVARAHHEYIHPGPTRGIDGVLSVAGLEIDLHQFEVKKDGGSISLSLTEFKLLKELAHNAGSVLSRQFLAERVWGHAAYADSPTVTMAISRLRDKIECDPNNPSIIRTVRGVGYRLEGGPQPDRRTQV